MSLITEIDRSLIKDFINNRIIGEEFTDSNNSKALTTAKIIGIAISALGKVPFISINLKINNLGKFKYALAIGNTLGFWALGCWSWINILDNVFKPLSIEEEILLKKYFSCIKNTAAITFAILISTLSQAVIAYLAYAYNELVSSFDCTN